MTILQAGEKAKEFVGSPTKVLTADEYRKWFVFTLVPADAKGKDILVGPRLCVNKKDGRVVTEGKVPSSDLTPAKSITLRKKVGEKRWRHFLGRLYTLREVFKR